MRWSRVRGLREERNGGRTIAARRAPSVQVKSPIVGEQQRKPYSLRESGDSNARKPAAQPRRLLKSKATLVRANPVKSTLAPDSSECVLACAGFPGAAPQSAELMQRLTAPPVFQALLVLPARLSHLDGAGRTAGRLSTAAHRPHPRSGTESVFANSGAAAAADAGFRTSSGFAIVSFLKTCTTSGRLLLSR